ncbi:MAG: glycosyltransferase family 9 protein [Bacteroidales bacterium]|nr:glycosyltransferase family 9 protein [Bacteroidales bacterium]
MKQLKKILVIQTASIGDVILATPIIETLHKTYPEAMISLVLKKGMEGLFASHPYVARLYLWDKSQNKLKNLYDILKEIQSERYDLVVNAQRFFLTGVLTAFSRARHTTGFNKNPMSIFFSHRTKHIIGNTGIHETERNLSLISHIIKGASARPRLYPSAKDDAVSSQYKTHKYICVAPASLWFTKQFPAMKWVEFLNEVPGELYVYFVGSENDRGLCEKIISETKHRNVLNLAGKLTFLETASLLRDAAMNFVNDSAPMHLASAVNAPVTAIFCSTVPSFGFGPLSGDSSIVETSADLSCRPCGLHGLNACPEKHFDCAMGISKEKLLQRIP